MMGLVGGIVVYIIVWWLVLFAVLPWGVSTQAEREEISPGTDPGAPAYPGLLRKLLITTAVAAGFWLVIYIIIANGLISLDMPPQGDPSG